MSLSDSLPEGLTCPINGAPLELDRAVDEENGLLGGGALPYPVLSGIPRLLADEARNALVALIAKGDSERALRIALSWPDRKLGNRLRRKVSSLVLRSASGSHLGQRLASRLSTGAMLSEATGSIEETLRTLDSGYFVDWLLHRFNARTFRPLLAFARYVQPGERVLDLGGGFGHGAWVLTAHTPPDRVTVVDEVFSHLYIAKTRMVPGIHAVAADLSAGPPFRDVLFDAIVFSDTLHFVIDQDTCVKRASDLLSTNGRFLVSQIHNGLVKAAFTGKARSPAGYADLFKHLHPRLLANHDVLERGRRGLDLGPELERSARDLNGVPELSLVADKTGVGLGAVQSRSMPARNARLSSLIEIDTDGALRHSQRVHEVVKPFMEWPDLSGWTLDRVNAAQTRDTTDRRTGFDSGILVEVPPRYFQPYHAR